MVVVSHFLLVQQVSLVGKQSKKKEKEEEDFAVVTFFGSAWMKSA